MRINVADRDSANDLVQDCVLQALDNHEKFTYSKNLKGWMYTLMRNIFVNNYRRTVREMNLIDDSYSINQNQNSEIALESLSTMTGRMPIIV